MSYKTRFDKIKEMNKEQLADFLFTFTCSANGGFEKMQEKEKFGFQDFVEYLNGYVEI